MPRSPVRLIAYAGLSSNVGAVHQLDIYPATHLA